MGPTAYSPVRKDERPLLLLDLRDLWFIDAPERLAQALGTKLQEDLEGLREDILNFEHGHPMFMELPPV